MNDSTSRLSPPSLPHEPLRSPGRGERETLLFDDEGVLVTSERVVIAGRTWPLGDVVEVDSVRRGPHVLPWLVTLIGGAVVGLPVLLSVMATPAAQRQELYNLLLGLAGAAIFGSIAALVMVGDTYWLVLRTRQREGPVLCSRDAQRISHLVTVVEQALEAARQRS